MNIVSKQPLSSAAPVNLLVGQIIFCYGNHTSKTFTDKITALNYINELWDDEDQARLLNVEMVKINHRGYEPAVVHRGQHSISRFVRIVEDIIDDLPCPGCDYQVCDCGLGLPLPHAIKENQ